MRSMFLLLAWLACTNAPVSPEVPSPTAQAAPARDALLAALKAEPVAPVGPAGEALRLAAEQASAVPIGDRELDLLLGDVLSNRLLRPDLGLARLEAAGAAAGAPDAWLDALLRHGDGPRFAKAYTARFPERAPVDVTHAAFVTYAQKAAAYPDLHWAEAVEAVTLAQLVEEGVVNARITVDRPLTDVALAVDVLFALVDPAPARIALGRTAVPSDPDPALDRRLLLAADGRKVVQVHRTGAGFAALHPAAAEIAGALSPRANTLCLEAAFDGGRQMFAVEIAIRDQSPWVFVANDEERFVVWVEAMDAWAAAREKGESDDVIQPRITATYGPRFRKRAP